MKIWFIRKFFIIITIYIFNIRLQLFLSVFLFDYNNWFHGIMYSSTINNLYTVTCYKVTIPIQQ